jgi:predicted O-methyltransferase YrrM
MNKWSIVRRIIPAPVRARHAEYSMVLSTDDDRSTPSPRLLSLGLEAAHLAERLTLEDIAARMAQPPYFPNVWPGEHYRLLAALVKILHATTVVEIGTYTGLSALTLKKHLPPRGRVATFDITPWAAITGTCLRPADFDDGRLVQFVGDLCQPEVFEEHRTLLASAELIFVDAAKDGVMEGTLLKRLASVDYRGAPIVVFDDIRLWKMLSIWRSISRPKLDLTSFGHWTGTGLVDWVAASGHALSETA